MGADRGIELSEEDAIGVIALKKINSIAVSFCGDRWKKMKNRWRRIIIV